MVSDGDYDAYGDRRGSHYLSAPISCCTGLKSPLTRRQAFWRWVSQVTARWAETDGGRD